jgi:hypothetical protein
MQKLKSQNFINLNFVLQRLSPLWGMVRLPRGSGGFILTFCCKMYKTESPVIETQRNGNIFRLTWVLNC